VSNAELRPELTRPLPPGIARLPVSKGYPVPFFSAWVGGVPEFRAADPDKVWLCLAARRCWVCGGPLSAGPRVFLGGPLMGLNRVSGEPPSHPDCAEWSARNCPFLTRPRMERRDDWLKAEGVAPGELLDHNPGLTLLWQVRGEGFEPVRTRTGYVFRLDGPEALGWWAEGRPAPLALVLARVAELMPVYEAEYGGDEESLTLLRAGAARLACLYPEA
jgi:hypothetical protein